LGTGFSEVEGNHLSRKRRKGNEPKLFFQELTLGPLDLWAKRTSLGQSFLKLRIGLGDRKLREFLRDRIRRTEKYPGIGFFKH
jgi:hypothetical protein